jgi:GDSL-like Lipase/Acylhydrolase family
MSPDPTLALSRRRTWLLALLTAAISTVLALLSCELLVRWLDPQATMVPRSRFSAAYGLEFYPNRTMVNELSGQWRFEYTTNAQGHRGPVMPVSKQYPLPNVVALGDSFTFGFGIADGQEYPAVLRQRLAASHGVVNLGTGGWGLTQEIRHYYDLGIKYDPRVVILQFAGNDPSDNLLYRVTTLENGRFVFHDRDESGVISLVKRYLSDSVLQHSHLYALARGHIYYFMRGREIATTAGAAAAVDYTSTPGQQFHNELLEAFARDLHQHGVRLLLIAVDDHLKEFPLIRAKMQQLHAEGLATFIDIDELFKTAPHDRSPEGHWGPVSQRTVAEALAREILNPAPRPVAPAAGK